MSKFDNPITLQTAIGWSSLSRTSALAHQYSAQADQYSALVLFVDLQQVPLRVLMYMEMGFE